MRLLLILFLLIGCDGENAGKLKSGQESDIKSQKEPEKIPEEKPSIKTCTTTSTEFVMKVLANDYSLEQSKKSEPGEILVLPSLAIGKQSVPDFEMNINDLIKAGCVIQKRVLLIVAHSQTAALNKDPIIENLKNKFSVEEVQVVEAVFKPALDRHGDPVTKITDESKLRESVKQKLQKMKH